MTEQEFIDRWGELIEVGGASLSVISLMDPRKYRDKFIADLRDVIRTCEFKREHNVPHIRHDPQMDAQVDPQYAIWRPYDVEVDIETDFDGKKQVFHITTTARKKR